MKTFESMTARAGFALLMLTLSAAARAQLDPAAFALSFPLDAPPDEPVFAIELTPAVYATLQTPDLRDLAVVDANGVAQPISVAFLERADDAPPPLRIALAAPVTVPGEAMGQPERLQLLVRGAGGESVDLSLPSSPPLTAGAEWLVDAQAAAEAGYDGLALRLPETPDDFRTLVTVRGSDDLATWTTLAYSQPLLRFASGGQTIERLAVELGGRHGFRYLAVSPASPTPLPTIVGLDALRRTQAQAAPLPLLVLEPVASAAGSAEFSYPATGPLPVVAYRVRVREPNGVFPYQLVQTVDGQDRVLAEASAWQVSFAGTVLTPEFSPLRLMQGGAMQLRFAGRPSAPAVELAYRPDRLMVVASGMPPYRLLAGSGRAQTAPVQGDAAIAAIRLARGAGWSPAPAAIGAAMTTGGAAALERRVAPDAGTLALWGVLLLGVLLVAGAAWRMLRTGPTPPQKD